MTNSHFRASRDLVLVHYLLYLPKKCPKSDTLRRPWLMGNCTYGLQRWPARQNAVRVASFQKGPFSWSAVRVATCRRLSVSVWPWHWRVQNSINKRVQESSSVLTFSFHHRLLLSMLHSHNKWTGKVSVRSDLREARSTTEFLFFFYYQGFI